MEQWQQYFAKLSPSGGLVLDKGVWVDSVYLACHSFAAWAFDLDRVKGTLKVKWCLLV